MLPLGAVPLPFAGWVESRAFALGVVWASAFAVAGCSGGPGEPQAEPTVGRALQPIIGGSPSGANRDAVVVLTTFERGDRTSLCTATVVAPNLLLTARHCVSEADGSTACTMAGTPVSGGSLKGDRDPTHLAVFVGSGGVAPDTEIETNASAHGAKLVVDWTPNLCNSDVAFVVLDTPLTTPIAPLRLGPPTKDEEVDVVGWGIDESGELPATREERSGVSLIGVGPALYPDNAAYGYGNHEFMLGESACAGDSGSPALAPSGAVTGVAARAGNGKPRNPNNNASTCMGSTAHAVYTHLSSMTGLVARAFAEAHQPIWLEGETDPRASKSGPNPDANTPSPPGTPASAELPPERAISLDSPQGATTGGCSTTSGSPGAPPYGIAHAAGFGAMLALFTERRRRRSAEPT